MKNKKHPSLFAIHSILKQLRSTPGSFVELAKCTPLVRNRRLYLEYLSLLVHELGWVRKAEREFASSSWRASRNRRYVTCRFYEITDSGRAFLDLFPAEEDASSGTMSLLKRPGLFDIQRILKDCNDASGKLVGITSFSFLSDVEHVISNRKNFCRYLKLLCSLGWLEKRRSAIQRLHYYTPTEKGRKFLELFPPEKNCGESGRGEELCT